jgi:ATP-dependent Lon protease
MDFLERAPSPDSSPPNPLPGAADAMMGEAQRQPPIPGVLPILPLRNLVLFPGTGITLGVGRPDSIRLLEESLPQNRVIGMVTQRHPEKENPESEDLYNVGTAAMVLKLFRQREDNALLIVHGLRRFRLGKFVQTKPYLRAEIEVLESDHEVAESKEWEAALKNLRETASRLIELTPDAPEEMRLLLLNVTEPGLLADLIASAINISVAEKQELLEELNIGRRIQTLQERVTNQLEIAHIQQRLQKEVSSKFTDLQRRAYLREQVRAIQRELGEDEEGTEQQVEQLRERLEKAAPPEPVMEQAERELKRLRYVPPASAEFSVIVSYLETLAELPWNQLTEDSLDLDRAQQILDRDHFDLEKVKRRLIEYLAVRKLNPEGRGPILCFLGPPGVGKTSLGQSIADALGRKFARISLGGMRDEAEIRGHRRTYIGSMPGRLIQELRRAGSRNPVLMLDEIDKLGSDFRGDPASGLLEVLDPRQNHSFVDHYLDVPFDLSQVIFIATANYLDPVPPALRDRMEIIEIPGYTEREKLEIAQRYLVGRQLRENGLKPEQCQWDAASLARVIEDYTREAGVRELERQIGAVCRAVAAQIARGEKTEVRVSPELVQEILGPAKYLRETSLKTDRAGVVTGLAYTPTGGEVLHIEATRYPGKGQMMLTGHIGDVMKESAQAALSLVRSRVSELGIEPDAFRETDIHVHVPSGAIPKDGPSAGIAMFTAIASLFTDIPARASVAMTGEITLRGLVLPIGGLKEKTLAAMRAGIEQVIIPKLNAKDLPDLPEEVKKGLKITLVEDVDEVLAAALERPIARPSVAAPPTVSGAKLDAAGRDT